MLSSNDVIDDQSISSVAFSTLINPRDLQAIMKNHNNFLNGIKSV